MVKVIDKGAVPPDDPMFTVGPQLHVPMPASELTRPTRPGHPAERLVELAAEYEKRFGHWIPMAAMRSLAISELNRMIEVALKRGEPIAL